MRPTTWLVLASALDFLSNLVADSPATYAVVLVGSGLDVIFPPIPSETIVITASILAATGGLKLYFLIPCAAVGAVIGDNIAYAIGRHIGEPAVRRLFRGERSRKTLEWAERQIKRRGPLIIIVGRFIPGGRTASTVGAGLLCMEWRRRFLPADIVAGILWAIEATLIGFIGGSAFKDSLWKPLGVAFALAAVVALAGEIYRRVTERRDSKQDDRERTPTPR